MPSKSWLQQDARCWMSGRLASCGRWMFPARVDCLISYQIRKKCSGVSCRQSVRSVGSVRKHRCMQDLRLTRHEFLYSQSYN